MGKWDTVHRRQLGVRRKCIRTGSQKCEDQGISCIIERDAYGSLVTNTHFCMWRPMASISTRCRRLVWRILRPIFQLDGSYHRNGGCTFKIDMDDRWVNVGPRVYG